MSDRGTEKTDAVPPFTMGEGQITQIILPWQRK